MIAEPKGHTRNLHECHSVLEFYSPDPRWSLPDFSCSPLTIHRLTAICFVQRRKHCKMCENAPEQRQQQTKSARNAIYFPFTSLTRKEMAFVPFAINSHDIAWVCIDSLPCAILLRHMCYAIACVKISIVSQKRGHRLYIIFFTMLLLKLVFSNIFHSYRQLLLFIVWNKYMFSTWMLLSLVRFLMWNVTYIRTCELAQHSWLASSRRISNGFTCIWILPSGRSTATSAITAVLTLVHIHQQFFLPKCTNE